MTIVLLIRHGMNDWVGRRLAGRMPGVHLNTHGQIQAEVLVGMLAGVSVQAIYSSPLERALETAAPLAVVHGLTPQIRDGLNELDYGQWQGALLSRLRRMKRWKDVQQCPSIVRFPGGESFVEAQNRIRCEIYRIAELHAGEKEIVACFSHGDMIRLAVAYFLNLPMDCFQRLLIDTASITVLHLAHEKMPRLAQINQTGSFNLV